MAQLSSLFLSLSLHLTSLWAWSILQQNSSFTQIFHVSTNKYHRFTSHSYEKFSTRKIVGEQSRGYSKDLKVNLSINPLNLTYSLHYIYIYTHTFKYSFRKYCSPHRVKKLSSNIILIYRIRKASRIITFPKWTLSLTVQQFHFDSLRAILEKFFCSRIQTLTQIRKILRFLSI